MLSLLVPHFLHLENGDHGGYAHLNHRLVSIAEHQ